MLRKVKELRNLSLYLSYSNFFLNFDQHLNLALLATEIFSNLDICENFDMPRNCLSYHYYKMTLNVQYTRITMDRLLSFTDTLH